MSYDVDIDGKEYDEVAKEFDQIINYISNGSNSVLDYFINNDDRLNRLMKCVVKTLNFYEQRLCKLTDEIISTKNIAEIKDKKILDLEIHSDIKSRKIAELENKLDEERLNAQYWINEYNLKQNISVVTPMTTTVNIEEKFQLFIECLDDDHILKNWIYINKNDEADEVCNKISDLVAKLVGEKEELEANNEEIGSQLEDCKGELDSIKEEIQHRIDDFKDTINEFIEESLQEQVDELDKLLDKI